MPDENQPSLLLPIARRGERLDREIKLWQRLHNLSNQEAYKRIGVSKATYTNYTGTHPKPIRNGREKVFRALGVASFEEARRKYWELEDGKTEFFTSWIDESENVFLSLLRNTTLVQETKLMMPIYPPAHMKYRAAFNRYCYERLVAGTLTVQKLEMVDNFDRLIDLAHNVLTFRPLNYQVRILKAPKQWYVSANFSVFDSGSVVSGASHKDHMPTNEMFFASRDKRFVEYYGRFFQRLWNADEAESLNPAHNVRDILTSYARLIPGRENETWASIEAAVKKRARAVRDYATRY